MNDQETSPEAKKQIDILTKQYEVAVDLYKHEDLLTWQKVNQLIFVMGGMFAIFAFLIERDVSDVVGLGTNEALYITALIGTGIAVLFSIAIWLGTYYLMARKKSVMEAEEKLGLQEEDFVRIVTPLEGSPESTIDRSRYAAMWETTRRNWLAKSWTVYVLRALPLGFLIFWAAVMPLLLSEQQERGRWDPGLFYSVRKIEPSVGHMATDSQLSAEKEPPERKD